MVERAHDQLRSLNVERSGGTTTATIKGSRQFGKLVGVQATGGVIILSAIIAFLTFGLGLLLIPLGIWYFAFGRMTVTFSSDGVVSIGSKKLNIDDLHDFHVWGSQTNVSGSTTFKRDILAYQYGRRDFKIGVLPPQGEGFEVAEELQSILLAYKQARTGKNAPTPVGSDAPIESREQKF